MIMTDAANGLSETATYCRKNDDKRPSLVGLPDGSTKQVCPVDGSEVKGAVHDAYPQGWFVRIMFDELLDPTVEDLTEILDDNGQPTGTFSGSIANTHPVNLKCTGLSGAMVDIPYDGYYSPAGNNVTWPLGPSLVIKPNLPATIPTNSNCQVTINDNVYDKNDHVQVPADERGPYTFQVAAIKVAAVSPADKDNLDGVDAGMDVIFNTLVDPNSVDDLAAWSFTPDITTTPLVGALVAGINASQTTFSVDPNAAPANGYFDFNNWIAPVPGCVPDMAGAGEDCDTIVTIESEQMHLTRVDYGPGPSFTPDTWTVTRGVNSTTAATHTASTSAFAPTNNTLSIGFGPNGAQVGVILGNTPKIGGKVVGANEYFVAGDYKAETDYTWTIPQGTKFKDLCGVETTFGAPSVDDFTQVKFTVNKLSFTGITPTDGTMAANPGSKIQLKFNQPMNPDSLAGRCSVATTVQCFKDGDCPGATETCQGVKFTLTPTVPNLYVIQDLGDTSKLDVYGDYQLDTQYQFTIPAGTQIAECPGGETLSLSSLGSPHGGSFYVGACDQKNVKSFTVDQAQTVTFKTAAAIALTGSTPADNAKITKPQTLGSSSRTSIRLTFNQEMDPTTLVKGPTGFDISPDLAMSVGADAGNFRNIRLRPKNGCTTSSTCTGYPPGTYTFTLHKGATIKDFLGNTYTQPDDLVIHFTISDPDPMPDCIP